MINLMFVEIYAVLVAFASHDCEVALISSLLTFLIIDDSAHSADIHEAVVISLVLPKEYICWCN